MNLWAEHAREVLGAPPEWRMASIEVMRSEYLRVDHDMRPEERIRITGAVVPLLKRGAWKGRPNWRKVPKRKRDQVILRAEEHWAWCEEWEKRNSTCYWCLGAGRLMTGFNVVDGARWEPCPRCKKKG